MNIFLPIDNYCERLDSQFLAEPLNLFSNLTFIIAAFLSWRLYRMQTGMNARYKTAIATLVTLIYAIGLGSALFHSIATLWSMWADVFPIMLFLIAYLVGFLKLIVGLDIAKTIGWVGIFIASTLSLAGLVERELVNGSNQYFGSLVALGAMAVFLRRKQGSDSIYFSAAAIIFAFSLFFRSIDLHICDIWPHGTHFLWHVLNGIVIYLVMRGLILLLAKRD